MICACTWRLRAASCNKNRLDVGRTFVVRTVDPRCNGRGHEVFAIIVVNQWQEHIGAVFIGIEPQGKRIARKNGGHAVMNGCHDRMCVGRENGEGIEFHGLSIGANAFPPSPESRESDERIVATMNPIRLFFPAGFSLPFKKAVCGYDASFGFEARSKCRFFRDGFGSRIDHPVADGHIVGPRWHKSPANDVHLGRRFWREHSDDRNVLRGRNVETRQKLRNFEVGNAKHAGEQIRGDVGQSITSTHLGRERSMRLPKS